MHEPTFRYSPFQSIPNGLDGLLGAIQLLVYAMYYKSARQQLEERKARLREINLEEVVVTDKNCTLTSMNRHPIEMEENPNAFNPSKDVHDK
ncbi:hypothetical protein AMTR_s00058p00154320 [Amborella trichopoda]|uniref:Bidirectional sugar transporter SWEET n=1 Tax=Amborella trichopoda TaxID=13333 RepID=W1PFW9_AMBTC|nr:hypothetical protein AMTR_s00058p00154320 [Amborella trichopoda]